MKYLLLASLLLVGCKEVKLVGDVFAKIYPQDGYADAATVTAQKPVKVTDPVEMSLSDMSGWICVPEKQFTKYRRAYESSQEMQSALETVHQKLNQKRMQDMNK